MSKWRQFAAVLVAGVAVFATGCGDSVTGTTGDAVTQAEAEALAEALSQSGIETLGNLQKTGGPALAPAASVTTTLDATDTCDGGGTVSVKGKVTVNTTTSGGTVDLDFTETPSGCQVTAELSGGAVVFTLTGNPNINVKGSFTLTTTTEGASYTGSLTYKGGIDWSSDDGRSGTCGVDLSASYTATFTQTGFSGSATQSGTVCGVSVSKTVTISGTP